MGIKYKKLKNGKFEVIFMNNRGHRKISWTTQGEPIPLDAKRVGTRSLTKAGSGGGKSRGLHGGNGGLERREKIADLRAKDES